MRNLKSKHIRKIIVNCFSKNVFVLKNVLCNTNYNTFPNMFINMNTLFYNQLYPRLKAVVIK